MTVSPPPRPPLEEWAEAPQGIYRNGRPPDYPTRIAAAARYALHLEAQLAEHEAAWERLTSEEVVDVLRRVQPGMRPRMRAGLEAARTAARRRGP
jgi:phosphoserine phosphatase